MMTVKNTITTHTTVPVFKSPYTPGGMDFSLEDAIGYGGLYDEWKQLMAGLEEDDEVLVSITLERVEP